MTGTVHRPMELAVGREVTDHFVAMKRAEWARYARAVTDWELREYLTFH